ncbi:MAG: hypothetical protein ACE5Q6_06835 [Dehalococcoidia bacterium]
MQEPVTREELQDVRADIRTLRSDLLAESRSRFAISMTVNVLLWMTTIGAIIGLFLQRGN